MGEDPREEKGEGLRGGKALGGERGERISTGKGGPEDLRGKREKTLGGENALGGKGRERISTRKGGKRS